MHFKYLLLNIYSHAIFLTNQNLDSYTITNCIHDKELVLKYVNVLQVHRLFHLDVCAYAVQLNISRKYFNLIVYLIHHRKYFKGHDI